jgi:formate-dependent nitrite reductase membrane component NrfD
MLGIIGVLLGCYVITQMVRYFEPGQSRSSATTVCAAITMIVAVYCIMMGIAS